LKKYCSVCGKELPASNEYFLCDKCHKDLIISEDKINYVDYSRLYY